MLPEGSVLALYTDGLVEARDRDVDTGTAALCAALRGSVASLESACDAALKALLPETPADDVALLLARTRALDAEQVAVWNLSDDPALVANARKLATDQLTRWGLEEAAFVTELVVSELVTNAIRYGGAPIQLRLIRDRTLICEVSDASSTSPHLRRARSFDEGAAACSSSPSSPTGGAAARAARARPSGPSRPCRRACERLLGAARATPNSLTGEGS